MPKIVDHDQEREQLLESSFALFAREGWAQATMRKLAAEAGVSTGKLYHYFPDKQAILDALFAWVVTRDAERVRNTLPPDAPVPERITALFDFCRDNRAYLEDLVRLALEIRRHDGGEGSASQVSASVATYRETVTEILGVPKVLGEMAFSFLLGMVSHGLLDPDAVDLDALEAFVQGLWRQQGL